jgi:inner membrane protein
MRFPLLAKAAAIALVMLLLVLVLTRIEGLVRERQARSHEARSGVEQSLAGAQTLLGPLLQRRCTEEWDVVHGEGRLATRSVERREIFLAAVPQRLQIEGDLATEVRRRGLFKVNGWLGKLTLQARFVDFAPLQPRA